MSNGTFNHPHWRSFDKFFAILLSTPVSQFEIDILHNCKGFMFSNWIRKIEQRDPVLGMTEQRDPILGITEHEMRIMLKAMGKTDEEVESAMRNMI